MLDSIAAGLRRRSVIIGVAALALSTSFVFISAPPGITALAQCNGLTATITGTAGDDVLVGTAGDDVIVARAGNDVIKAKGGNDVVCGGTGKDKIIGGGGADVLLGGDGADTIFGGKGADEIEGGKGADWIEGGGGGDVLTGGGGADAIDGGGGNDTVKGSGGADTLVGGAGNDTAKGGPGTDACKAETEGGCEENPVDFDLERFFVNQSVPAADSGNPGAVEVVAKRAGIARAFVGTNRTGTGITPKVRLFWKDNAGQGSVTLTGPNNVKKNPKESLIGDTFNHVFDSSFLKTSTEIYVEVDPAQKILEGNEKNNRYPKSGWLDLNAVNLGSLNVEFLPTTVDGGAQPSISKGQQFDFAERIFPVSTKKLTVGPTYDYTQEIPGDCIGNWIDLLNEVTAKWFADGAPDKFYASLVDDNPGGNFCGVGGIAWINQPGFLLQQASVSLREPTFIFAHELGHNLGLPHAPCGGAGGVDPNYPYPNAEIGVYGWDIKRERLYEPSAYVDIMAYCNPYWISDYNYQNVIEGRKFFGFYSTPAAADEVVMAFTGSIEGGDHEKADPATATGKIILAQQVDGVPRGAMPGPYQLVGVDADGATVAVVSFGTHEAESNNHEAYAEGFGFTVKMKESVVDQVVEWQVRRGARVLDAVAAG